MTLIAFLLWSIATVAVSYSGPKTMMETVLDFRGTAIVSFWAALVGLPLTVLLVQTVSPTASLIGLFVSEVMVFVGCWIGALKAVRRRSDSVKGSGSSLAIPIGSSAGLTVRSLKSKLCVAGSTPIQEMGPGI